MTSVQKIKRKEKKFSRRSKLEMEPLENLFVIERKDKRSAQVKVTMAKSELKTKNNSKNQRTNEAQRK